MGSKTYYNASTQRLLSNKDFKSASELALQMYIYKQRKTFKPDLKAQGLPEELVSTHLAASHRKFKRLRKIAENDGYWYGLPTSSFTSETEEDIDDIVNEYLQTKHLGQDVKIITSIFSKENVLTTAWEKLIEVGQYDSLTNELLMYSNVVGSPCYLVDGVITLTQESLDMLAKEEISEQVGLALSSGEFLDRPQDLYQQQPDILKGTADVLNFRYGYEKDISDTISPPAPIVNNITSELIDGYAEYNALIDISINGGAIHQVSADNDGYFSYVITDELVEGDLSEVTAKDASSNISAPTTQQYPFTNPNLASEGSVPSPTKEIVYVEVEMGLGAYNIDYGDNDLIPGGFKHIQTFYTVDGGIHLLNYEYLSGGIPEIDALSEDSILDELGKYYPRVYIRLDSVDVDKLSKTDERRKSSIKATKLLGIDLPVFTKQIKDSIEDINDEYKHVYLDLGLSPKGSIDDMEVCNYLFSYFNKLYPKCTKPQMELYQKEMWDKDTGTYYVDAYRPNGRLLGVSHTVKDKIISHKVSFESINRVALEMTPENISKYGHLNIGDTVGEFKLYPSTEHLRDKFVNDEGYYKEKYTRGDNYYITYVKRVSEFSYVEISIQRLNSSTIFYGAAVNHISNSDSLTIPLDYAVVETMSFKEKEVIFNRALNISITHVKVVKEKWYETGVFKVVMAIVSVAINVIVPGSGLTLQALLTAAATTIIVGIAINFAITLLVNIAISLGISPEFVATLAAIATVALMFMGQGTMDFSKLANAKDLMQILNTTLDAYQKGIQNTIAKLQDEMALFSEYMKDQNKKLEAAQDMLITGFIPPDLELLTAPISGMNDIYLGESPLDFYTRTTIKDVTSMTLNMVDVFLETTTSLPKVINKLGQHRLDNNIDNVLLIN